jgi:hypothetical protein
VYFFSSFKIHHLVAQIVDWVKMAQGELADSGVANFVPLPCYFDPEKLLKLGYNVN